MLICKHFKRQWDKLYVCLKQISSPWTSWIVQVIVVWYIAENWQVCLYLLKGLHDLCQDFVFSVCRFCCPVNLQWIIPSRATSNGHGNCSRSELDVQLCSYHGLQIHAGKISLSLVPYLYFFSLFQYVLRLEVREVKLMPWLLPKEWIGFLPLSSVFICRQDPFLPEEMEPLEREQVI